MSSPPDFARALPRRRMAPVSDLRKLLFVSQQAPWPLDSGGNLRSYHLLRSLCERFAVTLVATNPGGEAQARLAEVAAEVGVVPEMRTRGARGRANGGAGKRGPRPIGSRCATKIDRQSVCDEHRQRPCSGYGPRLAPERPHQLDGRDARVQALGKTIRGGK